MSEAGFCPDLVVLVGFEQNGCPRLIYVLAHLSQAESEPNALAADS
jgi:hypothetical protein